MKRDRRYFKAHNWCETRAKAMPGVVFSAAIDDERLSCTAERLAEPNENGNEFRTHWRTWQVFPVAKYEEEHGNVHH